MARMLLVLDEVRAMLKVVGASDRIIREFTKQAEFALRHKMRAKAPDREEGTDSVTVSSGYGSSSGVGFVELTINETLTQMDPAKAREIGLMLIQSSEAAINDEVVAKLLMEKAGADATGVGRFLLDLREKRQGTKGIAWPS